MSEMIALDRLSKAFGDLVAVDNVSLSVARGEVLGFLGPNGAGKSTTMKMIAGFLEPSSGNAMVSGFDVVASPVDVKKRIGYLPEGAPTYGDMTPRRFLDFIAQVRGFDGAERSRRVDEVVEKVILGEVMSQPIETLSKGFKRRVGLAQSMLHDPEVLILDEPTDGLDPNQKHHVRGLIQDMAHDKAIIVSTHILEEVEAVCSRAVIIAHGKILADGTPDELIARARNHNAVVVGVTSSGADKAAKTAVAVDGVETVETLSSTNGIDRLRILPKAGAAIVLSVGDAMKAADVDIREIFVEKGALDDVFRDVTMGGDGGQKGGENEHA
ncbi:MAG: ABC transporter ATP-binding protein [Rhodospirillaceae bacterium]|jgi:ABC-2 type transport system ATP-binding protein|nr:ABC transporter ATP-binding protein [Rhodospirillaceae bacterium]MBT3909476.1 ABC transporter ATP-binding protein [Rhodospirillaceae bacterium]MBT5299391.1 ABC transporter ATP-binding protein [Rhodospirillaceae bacterium]MBT5515455.1 ABC transporter ATP-binding protein [Rhodospirillaceae bacterium]MBT6086470.1 ABC transporter ATP-binding protein [Rhodospirillaceae bacterium]